MDRISVVLFVSVAVVATTTASAWMVPTTSSPRSSASVRLLSLSSPSNDASSKKGTILVLGGTGFLGQAVCQQALQEGFEVTSLSRRGLPPSSSNTKVDYRTGDATNPECVKNILKESTDYVGMVHCIGLLLDGASGLGDWNQWASGSGSIPSADSTYDAITRQTALNALEAARTYAQEQQRTLPFCFTSAAEAGWPEMTGGPFVEQYLTPDFLQRYLTAKRAVEHELLSSSSHSNPNDIRPIVVRPSLIYSLDRPQSYVPVGAFAALHAVGVPFVDPPVTVQALAKAIVTSLQQDSVSGVLRYDRINQLAAQRS